MQQLFLNDIRRGLGKAYLELSNAPNRAIYLDTLIYACLHDSSFKIVIEGPKSDYLYDLILLYDIETQNKIRDKIIETLSINDSYDVCFQKLELLYEYFNNGDLTILPMIKDFYHKMLECNRWTKKRYMILERVMIILHKMEGLKVVNPLLDDIDRLKLNQEMFLWFFSILNRNYNDNIKIRELIKKTTEEKREVKSFEDYLKEDILSSYRFIHQAADEEYEKCLKHLKSKPSKADVIKIIDNHSFFHRRKLPESILFDLIDVYDKETNETIYKYLTQLTSPKVEELGIKLLNTPYHCYGIIALMNNYKKSYKDIISNAFKKITFRFHEPFMLLVSTAIDFMDHKRKGYPDDILIDIFYHSYDSFNREYVFDCMKKRNLITKKILEESVHDFNYDIKEKSEKMLAKWNE